MNQPAIEILDENGNLDENEPLNFWEILREIILALVSQPEQVRIMQYDLPQSLRLDIHVAEEDLGKVIGKNGETITTIRKLFAKIGANRGRKTSIQVVEPKNPRKRVAA